MVIARTMTVLCLLAALTACGDDGGTKGTPRSGSADPDGRTYVVTSVTQDGEPYRLVRDTEIRLRFADGNLTLTAGCNTMSGGYTLDGSRMTVKPLAMTEMGCDQDRMEQDSWLAGLFERPVQFNDGSDAAVISGGTVLALADRRTVSPDLPLAGTDWVLNGTSEGDAASSVPSGTQPPTLRITDAGQAQVFDGCNRGSGPAEVDDDSIRFGPRMTTLSACSDQMIDAFVNAVLDGETSYTIEERSLTISNGDRSLTFVAPAR